MNFLSISTEQRYEKFYKCDYLTQNNQILADRAAHDNFRFDAWGYQANRVAVLVLFSRSMLDQDVRVSVVRGSGRGEGVE